MIMSQLTKIIPDSDIEKAFQNTNFGESKPRDVLKFALLKVSCNYHNGSTSSYICESLGLVKNGQLTDVGRRYLYLAFSHGTNF